MKKQDSPPKTIPKSSKPCSLTPLEQFKASMKIGFEEWHDGIGYDIQAIRNASKKEQDEIEEILINHSPRDWRDIEALAEINTKKARKTIKEAIKDPNHIIRIAVIRFAPELITKEERTESIIYALQKADFFEGLSQVLTQVELYHPKEIIEALLEGLLNRKGEIASIYAGMLFYLFGKTKTPFDMKQRPFFSSFNTEDKKERVKMFQELCKKLEINPKKYLTKKNKKRKFKGFSS